jgi:hypothetical protein
MKDATWRFDATILIYAIHISFGNRIDIFGENLSNRQWPTSKKKLY